MQKLKPNDPETTSLNGLTQNLTRLHDLFPEAFTEGRLNFDTLRELLADQIDDQPEKYGLNWNGKARARRHALTPTRATLRPDMDSSIEWDTTQNLMIEGDNLEVLKLLQRSYAGKVKLIYIDPPYNTGKDFVYPDNYTDSLRNYQEITGQTEDGRRVSSNTESSGRFHTDWLNMMYPRLWLARELLAENGIIAVSINDSEVYHLRSLMNQVMGEENFIVNIIWNKNHSAQAGIFKIYHEYLLIYAKNLSYVEPITSRDSDQFEAGAIKRPSRRHSLQKFTFPAGTRFDAPDGFELKGTWGDAEFVNLIAGSMISSNGFLADDVTLEAAYTQIGQMNQFFYGDRDNLFDTRGQKITEFYFSGSGKLKIIKERGVYTPPSILNWGTQADSSNALSLLFGANQSPFDSPKPIKMINDMIDWFCGPEDLVLDFFAGSGTTGHSVMANNSIENARRRFILVQLPESLSYENPEQKVAADFCDSIDAPRTIAELTKERLRRAGAKVKAENPMFSGDTGFRVFKLDSSNVKAWDETAARADLPAALQFAEDNIKPDRTEWDVLYEVLLKLGLPLTTPIEERTIAGHTVQLVGGGSLMACLSREIQGEAVQELGQGMADWLAAEDTAGDSHILFLDSAFRDDSAKLNLSTYLLQRVATLSPKRNWVVRSL